ncbi:hypothetical protein AB4Y64_11260 [Lysobacter sp. TAF61]|uniref:hypothetical protein n=1 Tax=Lysobacter sp. TAF61 TaxID=3233072 RepID=UPI003F993250
MIGTVDAFTVRTTAWPIAAPQGVETGASPKPGRDPARKPTPVSRSLRTLSNALRASFLALLVLGLVSRPATGLGCDLLAMEHGSILAASSGQGHVHPDHNAPLGDHTHAKGAHTLMHQHFAGASVDASAAPFVLADTRTSPVPTPSCVPVSRLQRAVPFRPPIA